MEKTICCDCSDILELGHTVKVVAGHELNWSKDGPDADAEFDADRESDADRDSDSDGNE